MAKENKSSEKSAARKAAAKKSPAVKAAAPKKETAIAAPKKEIAAAASVSTPYLATEHPRTGQPSPAKLYDEIRRRAYEFYCERGGQHGSHEADWHRAEAEVRSKYKP